MAAHRSLAAVSSVLSVLGLTAVACSSVEPDPNKGPDPAADEDVGEAEQAFSEIGVERVIPLRFVQFVPPSNTADILVAENAMFAVERANRIYGQAGIQFQTRSVEKFVSSVFYTMPRADQGPPSYTWAAVKAEIQAIIPGVPANAWTDSTSHTAMQWLDYAFSRFGSDSYTPVWVHSAGGSEARFPWDGRSIFMTYGNFPAPQEPYGVPSCGAYAPEAPATNNFTHELGHFLGLVHPWQMAGGPGIDPRTNTALKMSDWYDLVYCPANKCGTNTFFNSPAEAALHEADLKQIDDRAYDPNYADPQTAVWRETVNGQPQVREYCYGRSTPNGPRDLAVACCPDCNSGTIQCRVDNGSGTYTLYPAGSSGMKGMLFDYGANVQQGINVVSSNYNSEVGLATSQKLQARRVIRWDMPLTQGAQDAIKLGANNPPSVITGRRNLLGQGANRESAFDLDFDGDGRRDIAVWEPPPSSYDQTRGTFVVLQSSAGYSQAQKLVQKLGVLGDTPIPTDMDGDGKTDFAVFHPDFSGASDTAQWKWCRSSDNDSCHSPQSQTFGARADIPLPGLDFDGNPATGEMAIFRPSNGRFMWKYVNGMFAQYKDFGAGRMPHPGLYDSDWKTDLVTWDPVNAVFEMRVSGDGYAALTTKSFPTVVPSQSGGTAAERASAVVVPLRYNSLIGPRRALSVFDPEGPPEGVWKTIWLPMSGSVMSTCDFGLAQDVPLGGYLDIDGDLAGDMVLFRAQSESSNNLFFFRPASYACSNVGYFSVDAGMHNHARPFMAADMDGDGKEDLGLVDIGGTWSFFYSSESFALPHTFSNLGSRASVPL